MGEKPSPLGENFILIVDAAARIKGFKERRGWSFHLPPRTLGSLDPKTSALAEGSWLCFKTGLLGKVETHRNRKPIN